MSNKKVYRYNNASKQLEELLPDKRLEFIKLEMNLGLEIEEVIKQQDIKELRRVFLDYEIEAADTFNRGQY